MPLQNRVDPFGRIVATPERGTLTGNRGILHDDVQRIVRRHASKAWIACVLDWRGVRREVMTGRTWTELFFVDEATALAAGHRPCAYCRRDDYNRFVAAWSAGNPDLAPTTGRRAPVVDAVLHRERRNRDGTKRTFAASAMLLPRGTMYLGPARRPFVALGDRRAAQWSFGGYAEAEALHRGRVEVLTPSSIVSALATGYSAGVATDCSVESKVSDRPPRDPVV